MVKGKYNYFDDLEALSTLSLSATSLACSISDGEPTGVCLSDLRRECDRLICKIEDALFSDFLPPLERDSIAAMTHCLSRVIDRSADILSDPYTTAAFMQSNQESIVCVKLANELKNGIFMLRRIKKPSECPDLRGHRELLSEGRQAHKNMLCAVRSGKISKCHREAIILTARLRTELSEAFDKLIEVMLNNI